MAISAPFTCDVCGKSTMSVVSKSGDTRDLCGDCFKWKGGNPNLDADKPAKGVIR